MGKCFYNRDIKILDTMFSNNTMIYYNTKDEENANCKNKFVKYKDIRKNIEEKLNNDVVSSPADSATFFVSYEFKNFYTLNLCVETLIYYKANGKIIDMTYLAFERNINIFAISTKAKKVYFSNYGANTENIKMQYALYRYIFFDEEEQYKSAIEKYGKIKDPVDMETYNFVSSSNAYSSSNNYKTKGIEKIKKHLNEGIEFLEYLFRDY